MCFIWETCGVGDPCTYARAECRRAFRRAEGMAVGCAAGSRLQRMLHARCNQLSALPAALSSAWHCCPSRLTLRYCGLRVSTVLKGDILANAFSRGNAPSSLVFSRCTASHCWEVPAEASSILSTGQYIGVRASQDDLLQQRSCVRHLVTVLWSEVGLSRWLPARSTCPQGGT